jgi:ABC-type Fe3+/spermidine/putrescine transport system ATPase subunit
VREVGSGCGKTMWLRLIAALQIARDGRVRGG